MHTFGATGSTTLDAAVLGGMGTAALLRCPCRRCWTGPVGAANRLNGSSAAASLPVAGVAVPLLLVVAAVAAAPLLDCPGRSSGRSRLPALAHPAPLGLLASTCIGTAHAGLSGPGPARLPRYNKVSGHADDRPDNNATAERCLNSALCPHSYPSPCLVIEQGCSIINKISRWQNQAQHSPALPRRRAFRRSCRWTWASGVPPHHPWL